MGPVHENFVLNARVGTLGIHVTVYQNKGSQKRRRQTHLFHCLKWLSQEILEISLRPLP